MIERCWRSLALCSALALSGCYPTVHEPLRVGTLTDAAPMALGFRVGVTTLGEARGKLEHGKFTGVVSDGYARESGARLEVLGADYQSRVHVFRSGKYEASLPLATHGLPPYGMALRLAKERRRPARREGGARTRHNRPATGSRSRGRA